MMKALNAKPGSRKRLKREEPALMRVRRALPAFRSRVPSPLRAAAAAAALRRAGPGATAYNAAAPLAGRLTLFQRLHAVHPYVLDACGELLRLLVGGMILDGLGIEQYNVREIARPQPAAVFQRQRLRWKRGEFAHRLLQRDDLVIADVFGQHSREVAVGTRMVGRQQEHALRGGRGGGGTEADPGQGHPPFDVLLAPQEVCRPDARAVLDDEVHRRVFGGFVAQTGDLGERLACERLQGRG